jgi:hypothetical protein
VIAAAFNEFQIFVSNLPAEFFDIAVTALELMCLGVRL